MALRVVVLVVIDSTLSQVALSAIFEMLVTIFIKIHSPTRTHLHSFHHSTSQKSV